MKKISLRTFGLIGIALFVPLFLLTFSDPQWVEKSASSFIEWRLKNETENRIDAMQLPESKGLEKLLGDKAAELNRAATERLEKLKEQLKNDTPAIVAAQIAKMRDLSCECRKKWEEYLRNSLQIQITSLEETKSKLAEFSRGKYMEIVQKLTLDVRIFLGVNGTIFVLLFLISFLKPRAITHLFLPGGLMLISTIICSYFYLFEQNWFYTIIYNDYTGFTYLTYLLVVFAFLCDIVFNKANITTSIINGILESIGQIGSVVPC